MSLSLSQSPWAHFAVTYFSSLRTSESSRRNRSFSATLEAEVSLLSKPGCTTSSLRQVRLNRRHVGLSRAGCRHLDPRCCHFAALADTNIDSDGVGERSVNEFGSRSVEGFGRRSVEEEQGRSGANSNKRCMSIVSRLHGYWSRRETIQISDPAACDRQYPSIPTTTTLKA